MKLKLLHKLDAVKLLHSRYHPKDNSREWFKGYHIFRNQTVVKEMYEQGKPLSCFCLDSNYNEVHVAFRDSDDEITTKRNGSPPRVAFLTLIINMNQGFTHETGMDFCLFNLKEGVRY